MLWIAARYGAFLAVIGMIGVYVATHWDAATSARLYHPAWLPPSVVLGLAAMLGFAWHCRLVLAAHNYHVPFNAAIALFFVPMLGKYVPGKVWSLIAALPLYRQYGVPTLVAAGCVGIGIASSVISGAFLAALGEGGAFRQPGGVAWAIAAAVGLGVAMHPRVLYPTVNRGLRLLGRDAIHGSLSLRRIGGLLGVHSAIWLAYGLAFYCLIRSIVSIPAVEAPRVIGVFAAAQVAGFLALFAPAGIGVREGVFLLGLTPLVGEGNAIAVAGMCRLWQTALELAMAGAGWCLLRRRGDPDQHPGEISFPPQVRDRDEDSDVDPPHADAVRAANGSTTSRKKPLSRSRLS